MYQRLSLACTLIHEPRLLLLDEPTVGVDPRLRQTFWQYFKRLTEEGRTVLITTHLMDEAEKCQKVGYMKAGRMAAEGSPQEIQRLAGLLPVLRLWLTDPEKDAALLRGQGYNAKVAGDVAEVFLDSHSQIKEILASVSPRDMRLIEPHARRGIFATVGGYMTPDLRRVGVVSLRVVRQLKRDRRTIGLIVFAPIVLMILFGYALSGDMSGVNLGLVDDGGHPVIREHIESISDFDLLHLRTESDAERLIKDGRLNGAVVLQPDGVRVLLDSSSLQISSAIAAAVQAGAAAEGASMNAGGAAGAANAGNKSGAEYSGVVAGAEGTSAITTRYIFGYDLEMMDTVGPAILGLVVFFFTFINAAISFIRERSQGTLEKFMVSPLSRVEMISGYVLGFSIFNPSSVRNHSLSCYSRLWSAAQGKRGICSIHCAAFGSRLPGPGLLFLKLRQKRVSGRAVHTSDYHTSDCAVRHLVAAAVRSGFHPAILLHSAAHVCSRCTSGCDAQGRGNRRHPLSGSSGTGGVLRDLLCRSDADAPKRGGLEKDRDAAWDYCHQAHSWLLLMSACS